MKGRGAGISFAKRRAIQPLSFVPQTFFFSCGLVFAATLTGCRPPGPRALLEGKELIERGQYTEAVERLEDRHFFAVEHECAGVGLSGSRLPSSRTGKRRPPDAYKKAAWCSIKNLVEVHYNLGLPVAGTKSAGPGEGRN